MPVRPVEFAQVCIGVGCNACMRVAHFFQPDAAASKTRLQKSPVIPSKPDHVGAAGGNPGRVAAEIPRKSEGYVLFSVEAIQTMTATLSAVFRKPRKLRGFRVLAVDFSPAPWCPVWRKIRQILPLYYSGPVDVPIFTRNLRGIRITGWRVYAGSSDNGAVADRAFARRLLMASFLLSRVRRVRGTATATATAVRPGRASARCRGPRSDRDGAGRRAGSCAGKAGPARPCRGAVAPVVRHADAAMGHGDA